MKLTTDELIAIGAALEIAINTDGIHTALIETQHCHDDDTVRTMIWDWRSLRARITFELQCPESDSEPHVIGMDAPTPENDPAGRFLADIYKKEDPS